MSNRKDAYAATEALSSLIDSAYKEIDAGTLTMARYKKAYKPQITRFARIAGLSQSPEPTVMLEIRIEMAESRRLKMEESKG